MWLTIKEVTELASILAASWAVISGVNAWKREFIGKRRIALAEQVLSKFFEIKDAFRFIRNPFGTVGDGSSRKREPTESESDGAVLDRGYVVIERYQKREQVFSDFNVLKYQFMAVYGAESGEVFTSTNVNLNKIFVAARMLSQYYWQRQGHVHMNPNELDQHFKEMRNHESDFWEISENDPINNELNLIQKEIEKITAESFRDDSSLFNLLTKKLPFFEFKK